MRYRLKFIHAVAGLCAACSLAIYGYGIADSPLANPEIHAQRELLIRHAALTADPAEARSVADAYWQRNPDVARDRYYGRNGKLGIFGAREHFDQHGRKEGRRWGL